MEFSHAVCDTTQRECLSFGRKILANMKGMGINVSTTLTGRLYEKFLVQALLTGEAPKKRWASIGLQMFSRLKMP